MKVQISQLETTLKSDLNDKSRLTEALAREREAFAQMESDFQVFKKSDFQDFLKFPEHYFQDLQSKFLAMKEDAEKQEDKLRYFAQVTSPEQKERDLATPQDNSVDANELEAALAHMKQMQNEQLTAPPRCFLGFLS